MHDTNFPPDPEFFPEAFSEFYVPGGEGTDWTPENTIVKAAGDEIILHHTDDTFHTISWNITHLDYDSPTFTVDVEIRALSGGVITTLTDENATRGGGSIDWDTNLPQDNGIYTYRITAEHNLTEEQGPPGLCLDTDKSSVLTVTVNEFYYCSKDVQVGTLKGVVKYTLNQDAWPGSVTIRFFGPDLEELDYPLTDQPGLAGTHFSDVYEIDAEYDENDELIGPIYCVVYADECEDTALLNRDGTAKPALQKGTTTLEELLNLGGATLIDPPLTEHEEEDPGAFVHYNIDNDDDSDNALGGTKHPGSDLLQQEDPVADEDDVLAFTVTFDPTIDWGKAALTRTGDAILIWTSAIKGEDDALLVDEQEQVWDLSVPAQHTAFHALIETSLFVEGAEYNGEADLKLQFLRPNDTLICEDVVHYTAIAANCEDQPRTEGTDYPGDLSQRGFFEAVFPNPGGGGLVRCEWSSLAPQDPTYNCIAWSVGRDDVWVNPVLEVPPGSGIYLGEVTLGGTHYISIDLYDSDDPGTEPDWGNGNNSFEADPEMHNFYLDQANCTPTGTGPDDAQIMYYTGYHGAKRRSCACGNGQWLMYESKCGEFDIIEHVHDQLDSGYSGRSIYYK